MLEFIRKARAYEAEKASEQEEKKGQRAELHRMAAEDNTREKERMIEQKQQREVELQRKRDEEARLAEEDPPFSRP